MQVTAVIAVSNSDRAHDLLEKQGTLEYPSDTSILWRLRSSGGVVTAYRTGKILIQGNEQSWTDQIVSLLQDNETVTESASTSDVAFTPHIGVDEAGKGDFFGPLVVGAVCVESAQQAEKLRTAGVRDSKLLSDSAARDIARNIRTLCPYHQVIVLPPSEYNSRYLSLRNANKLLAQLHAQAIESVLSKMPEGTCGAVVIDQFSRRQSRVLDELMENGRKLEVTQMHKGERDIAVAAASILARAGFLEELEALSEKYEMKLPKGATHVIPSGKEFVKKYGANRLGEVAKTSFKTALMVTSTFDL